MYVVRFDTLHFMAQGELPVIYMPHPLDAQWPLRTGSSNLANPTFGDNTAMRGSESCGLVGNGWYGSAEYYQGPLSGLGTPGSYLGDSATGTLVSRPFTVSGDLIRLRVGGGHYPATCYVALIEELKQSKDPNAGRVIADFAYAVDYIENSIILLRDRSGMMLFSM